LLKKAAFLLLVPAGRLFRPRKVQKPGPPAGKGRLMQKPGNGKEVFVV
jgi:hypothetical protein